MLAAPYPALQGAISVHPGHLQQAQKGLECGRFGLCKGVSVCVQCVCGAAPYLLVLAVLYLQGRVWATGRHPGGSTLSPRWQLRHLEGAVTWVGEGGKGQKTETQKVAKSRFPPDTERNHPSDMGSKGLHTPAEVGGP